MSSNFSINFTSWEAGYDGDITFSGVNGDTTLEFTFNKDNLSTSWQAIQDGTYTFTWGDPSDVAFKLKNKKASMYIKNTQNGNLNMQLISAYGGVGTLAVIFSEFLRVDTESGTSEVLFTAVPTQTGPPTLTYNFTAYNELGVPDTSHTFTEVIKGTYNCTWVKSQEYTKLKNVPTKVKVGKNSTKTLRPKLVGNYGSFQLSLKWPNNPLAINTIIAQIEGGGFSDRLTFGNSGGPGSTEVLTSTILPPGSYLLQIYAAEGGSYGWNVSNYPSSVTISANNTTKVKLNIDWRGPGPTPTPPT